MCVLIPRDSRQYAQMHFKSGDTCLPWGHTMVSLLLMHGLPDESSGCVCVMRVYINDRHSMTSSYVTFNAICRNSAELIKLQACVI